MARFILTVFSDPVDGQADEYLRWYTEEHLVDLMKVPEIVGARLLRMEPPDEMNPGIPQRYLAIYEIEGEGVGHILSSLKALREASELSVSDAIALPPGLLFYRELGSASASTLTPD
jgi:hypothetical protein